MDAHFRSRVAAAIVAAGALLAGHPGGVAAAGTISVDVDPPPAPVAKLTAGYQLRLAWTAPAAEEAPTGYTVYRGTSPESMASRATLEADQLGWTDPDAAPGISYRYVVSATNSAGEGAQSAAVSGKAVPTGVLVATDRGMPKPADPYDWPDRRIALIAADGTRQVLSTGTGHHNGPALSPDGSVLVYSSDQDSKYGEELWAVRSGGKAEKLTSGSDSTDLGPAFSPDGRTIAFNRFIGLDEEAPIYTVPATGGTPRRIAGTDYDSGVAWSPSGRLLAVAHRRMDAKSWIKPIDIQVLSRDGKYRRSVAGAGGSVTVKGSTMKLTRAYSPDWSPDGRSLSFIRLTQTFVDGSPQGDPISAVYRVPAGGGTAKRLTDPAKVRVYSQQWGPSGRIVLDAEVGGNTKLPLWTIPDDGSAAPQAVPGAGSEHFAGVDVAEPAPAYVPVAVPAVGTTSATLGAKSATLSWKAPAGASWYVVRRSKPADPEPTTPEQGSPGWAGAGTTGTLTGLADGTSYRLTVFAMSASGDAGPGVSHLVQPAAPPTVKPDGAAVSIRSGRGTGFTATWGGALPDGQTYEAQLGTRTFDAAVQKWSGVAYQALSTGAATSASVATKPGTTYYVRARVRDSNGNATPWTTVAVPVPYDDRAFKASAGWSSLTGQAGRFAGTLRSAKKAGAALTLAQWGSEFALLADRCATCGAVQIYLDGKLVATVDTYAKNTAPGVAVWTKKLSGIGRHTVKVVVVGTPKRPYARVDGLVARR